MCIAAVASSIAYAAILNRIHHIYAPDYIWVTVVAGNAIIWGWLALWLWLEPTPAGMALAPAWRLLALNLAAGLPIIVWQIYQASQRPSNRRRIGG